MGQVAICENLNIVDIMQVFFGIRMERMEKSRYNESLSYFLSEKERCSISIYNDTIKKDEALTLAKEFFKHYSLEFAEFYISKEAIKIHSVTDIFNKAIFDLDENLNGWLIFINPLSIANWSHYCEYWFIVNKDCYYFAEGEWEPNDSISLGSFQMIG